MLLASVISLHELTVASLPILRFDLVRLASEYGGGQRGGEEIEEKNRSRSHNTEEEGKCGLDNMPTLRLWTGRDGKT